MKYDIDPPVGPKLFAYTESFWPAKTNIAFTGPLVRYLRHCGRDHGRDHLTTTWVILCRDKWRHVKLLRRGDNDSDIEPKLAHTVMAIMY